MSKIIQDEFPWGIDDQIFPDDRCRKKRHPINIVDLDIETEIKENSNNAVTSSAIYNRFKEVDDRFDVIDEDINNLIISKQDKLEAGASVSIEDGKVNAVLDKDITSDVEVGGVIKEKTFTKGTPITEVFEAIFKKLAETTMLYFGATDRPTTSRAELNKEEVDVEELTSTGIERKMISKYVPTTDEGQYPTIAVDKSIKLHDWKNKETGFSYLDDIEHVKTDRHNIYRFKHSVFNEDDGGEDEVFTFVKEGEE